jgi:hypothetical protein
VPHQLILKGKVLCWPKRLMAQLPIDSSAHFSPLSAQPHRHLLLLTCWASAQPQGLCIACALSLQHCLQCPMALVYPSCRLLDVTAVLLADCKALPRRAHTILSPVLPPSDMYLCTICSLLCPQHPGQYLAHSRCLVHLACLHEHLPS